MQGIGREIDQKTGVFSSIGHSTNHPKFLDLCMAPGGFSQFLIDLYPNAEVCGISLPPSSGGHEMLLDLEDPRVKVQLLDITMLASEMQTSEKDTLKIPQNHPDAGNFRTDRPYLSETFDLVICDGQVLRTHERLEYRERVEAGRLFVSQLVIGLSRIRKGGTMVVLLHKLEAWRNMKLLDVFNKFSYVQLFKPQRRHALRSSFYMIATDVQPQNPYASEAVDSWKKAWIVATFGSPEEKSSLEQVQEVLTSFGEQYLRLGNPIWSIQKIALEKSNFCH